MHMPGQRPILPLFEQRHVIRSGLLPENHGYTWILFHELDMGTPRCI
jgi:hypothetical protein